MSIVDTRAILSYNRSMKTQQPTKPPVIQIGPALSPDRMAQLEQAFSFTAFYGMFKELQNEIYRLRLEARIK